MKNIKNLCVLAGLALGLFSNIHNASACGGDHKCGGSECKCESGCGCGSEGKCQETSDKADKKAAESDSRARPALGKLNEESNSKKLGRHGQTEMSRKNLLGQ